MFYLREDTDARKCTEKTIESAWMSANAQCKFIGTDRLLSYVVGKSQFCRNIYRRRNPKTGDHLHQGSRRRNSLRIIFHI